MMDEPNRQLSYKFGDFASVERLDQTQLNQAICRDEWINSFGVSDVVIVFEVMATGTLVVDTRSDSTGNRFGARVIDPVRECVIAEACGTGSTTEYTGEIVVPNVPETVLVEAFVCSGSPPLEGRIRFRSECPLFSDVTEFCRSETGSCFNYPQCRSRGVSFE